MTSTYEHVIMYCHRRRGVKRAFVVAACLAALATGAEARAARHRHHAIAAIPRSAPATGVAGSGVPFASDDDAFYRERGYGIGGVPFSLGGGGLALDGACAQVANRNPACGAAGGYGVYGNGLGYGFGAR